MSCEHTHEREHEQRKSDSCGCSSGRNHENAPDHAPADSCEHTQHAHDSLSCGCGCGHDHGSPDEHEQTRMRNRILAALALFALAFAVCELAPLETLLGSAHAALAAEFVLFAIPYLLAGYDVLLRAARNIAHGRVFDENFLMSIATLGAFAMVAFPEANPHMAEGAAVMLFYQVGELFQDYAVGKSRASIAAMMDIAPTFATLEQRGELLQVSPERVAVGSVIVVKPGERIPLDGTVIEGTSQLDTAALTGESAPRSVHAGESVISGCVNLSGVLRVQTTKPYGESTVSRILDLVENASEKKARSETFISRFARIYTPVVVGVATCLAVLPPLLGMGAWSDWILRGLIFLVVSCPCALVISVPLSFFGGIGGASRLGILVKGSNYLEALSKTDTVVFDKTGTLTSGTFEVTATRPAPGTTPEQLLDIAAHAELYSNHPIAASIKRAFNGEGANDAHELDAARVSDTREEAGHGVYAVIDGAEVLAGNAALMTAHGIDAPAAEQSAATVVHVARGGAYLGYLEIEDAIKQDAAEALAALRQAGVTKTVMLTGDREDTARHVAKALGIDEYRAELLPQDKVACIEQLLESPARQGAIAFVGDGINDAPVLMRADVGIAMGALGSDAAIEAADIVLMNDNPADIARAKRIAHKTMRIVRQNIVGALGIKFSILALAAFGLANMWLAVFADVGVSVIAILNAMRTLRVSKLK